MWCIAKTLYNDLENNMTMFEKWGVAGLKVDFLERDDQLGEQDYHRIAESAARHHLLLEYHGATNPAGLTRTYPNLLTFEAVYGSEQNMGGNKATETKSIQVKVGTGDADLALKAKQASLWLKEGHRIKVELFLKGRTKYMDENFLKERLDRVLHLITEQYKIAEALKKVPKGLMLTIEREINK